MRRQLAKRSGPIKSEVWVYDGTTYGSTNTKIRIFTTVGRQVGSKITYVTSAANGDSFTVNCPGPYLISYCEEFTAAGHMGISVNSSQLTTSIETITAADRRACCLTAAVNIPSSLCVGLYLNLGDVVRAHTGGGTPTTNNAGCIHFRILEL